MKFNKFLLGVLILFSVIFISLSTCSAENVDFNTTVNESIGSSTVSLPEDYNDSSFFNVTNSKDFYKIMKKLDSPSRDNKTVVVINMTKDSYTFNCDGDVLFNYRSGTLIIFGNGASFSSKGHGNFLKIGSNANVYCVDCVFKESKPAIRNYGTCNLLSCIFIDNKRADTINTHGLMDYGGAIDNYGMLTCTNSTFKNNRGSYGGAVCGEDNSINIFYDCNWGNNEGGHGEDLFLFNGATAYVYLNTTQQVPDYDGFTTSSLHVFNASNVFNNKFVNIDDEDDLYGVFYALNLGVFNFTDVTLNLSSKKVYQIKHDGCSSVWGRLKHGIHDGIVEGWGDFLGLRKIIKSVPDFFESLFVETRVDEADDYGDDNILCWIKGGLNVRIIGNGATLSMRDSFGKKNRDSEDYHLFFVSCSSYLTLENLSINNFNSAIINKGNLFCFNTSFSENLINYVVSGTDLGGAIRNYGTVEVTNSSFTHNFANKGGAIYNKGTVKIQDSVFDDNVAYLAFKSNDLHIPVIDDLPIIGWLSGIVKNAFTVARHVFSKDHVNDIYNCDEGLTVVINSMVNVLSEDEGIFVNRKSTELVIRNFTVNSTNQLVELINKVNNDNGKTDIFNITLTSKEYTLNKNEGFNLKYGALLINGKDAVIKCADKNEKNFIKCSSYSNVLLYNLTINGFKTAIDNKGNCVFNYCIFKNNKVDYFFARDYAGVLDNSGICTFLNCSFIGNSAKYGGVTFNAGSCTFIDCFFKDNTGYSSDGVGVYDTGLGVSRFLYSDNSTYKGSYYLDTGLSNGLNAFFTYTLKWLTVACFASGVGCGLSGAGLIGSIITVSVATGVSITMNGIRDNYNHNVHLGKFICNRLVESVNYVMMYYLGYKVGSYIKKVYNKWHAEKLLKIQDQNDMANQGFLERNYINKQKELIKKLDNCVSQNPGYVDTAPEVSEIINELLNDPTSELYRTLNDLKNNILNEANKGDVMQGIYDSQVENFNNEICYLRTHFDIVQQYQVKWAFNKYGGLARPIPFDTELRHYKSLVDYQLALVKEEHVIPNNIFGEGTLHEIYKQIGTAPEDFDKLIQYAPSTSVTEILVNTIKKNFDIIMTEPTYTFGDEINYLSSASTWLDACLRIRECFWKWNEFMNQQRILIT